jgi:RNA polymerase sigma factor (sigma-70 family)
LADRDRHIRAGLRRGARLRFAADDRLVAFVRAGDSTAFEILYERHVSELLSFCRHMLRSQADAEDAVQATFASAHRALLADDRTVELRPWLFAIARNACLSILRIRRPLELSAVSRSNEDPVAEVERREEMREVLAALLELPENQRVALVLSELHGFSQSEIGDLLGVATEQVKSYVYQARSNLISERDARSADCHAIRQELASARGPALLRTRLRRHLRSCSGCRQYAAELSRKRDQLGSLLPVLPSLALKRRVLDAALGNSPDAGTYAGAGVAGGSVAASAVELAGGGAKALIAKLLTGMACLSIGSGAATVVLSSPPAPAAQIAPASDSSRLIHMTHESAGRAAEPPAASSNAPAGATDGRTQPSHTGLPPLPRSQASEDGAADTAVSDNSTPVTAAPSGQGVEEARGNIEQPHIGGGEEAHGASEGPRGKSEEAHGASEEPHGKSEEPHGKSQEAHGASEEPHGKIEEAATHGKSEEAHGSRGEAPPPNKGEEARGKSEEARGKSEEVHGHREEALADGKSEEAHGKANGE